MDILFWIILIVVVAAVVWWLLNRNKSASAPGASAIRSDGALEGGSAAASAEAAATTGIPTAAGFGRAAEPEAPPTAEEPADSSATPRTATPAAAEATDNPVQGPSGANDGTASPGAVGREEERRLQDEAEWETQWSEAGPSGSRPAPPATNDAAATAAASQAAPPAAGAGADAADDGAGRQESRAHSSPAPAQTVQSVVHHDEYTAPHAPTLPGAETAAGEETAAAETTDHAEASAPAEEASGHHDVAPGHSEAAGEPAGHLAAEEPYGAGSASPAADGSGPADYSVKGDAAAMVYYEEGHPDHEQIRADVWFESAAHAEAAGFRAPRRKRL
ncbi:sunset domain-containing protein [Arthrobacter sp. MMS24-T111]